MRLQLSNNDATIAERQHALSILATDSAPSTLPILLETLDVPELRLPALRQLSRYDDPRIATELISRLPTLNEAEHEAAMETLCGHPVSALALLNAVEDGLVDTSAITGFFAQQLSNLNNDEVNQRLEEQWGVLQQFSEETREAILELVTQYEEAPLWAYSSGAGAATFNTLCATCHVQSENSRIGPKLDGSGAKGIEYTVENIIDPDAVIGKDFQAQNILTIDGLVITGVILQESDSSITVRTATNTVTVAKDDIEEIVTSTNSFMPKGLLTQLTDQQRLELLKYLMSLQ